MAYGYTKLFFRFSIGLKLGAEGRKLEIMLLKDSFDQLQRSLAKLTEELKHTSQTFIACQPGEFLSGDAGVEQAALAIGNVWNSGIADGRETSVCIGAIGVDERVLELAQHVNLCKDRFKAAVQILQDRVKGRGDAAPSKAWKNKITRNALTSLGLGRLSLRLCNRHIPVIDYQPHTIGISYSSGGRSIKRMTPKSVLVELKALGYESDSARLDYKKIEDQPSGLILAKVTPLAGYYKANIFKEKSKLTKTIPVFLPILYLNEKSDLVNHTPCLPVKDNWKRMDREPRSDKKISEEPLITTLPIYTYVK